MAIVLCGFMGAGKSHLLKRIDGQSHRLVDLDQLIESQVGSIPVFISQNGWDAFRTLESELLKVYIRQARTIISVGGGALTRENIDFALEKGQVVWIDTPYEECWERIKDDSHRPLVSLGREKLEEIFSERIELYQRAHIRLNAECQKRVNNTTDLLGLLDEAQRKV